MHKKSVMLHCHVVFSVKQKAEHELYKIHHRLTSVYCHWSLNH